MVTVSMDVKTQDRSGDSGAGSRMAAEVAEQPLAVQRTLDALLPLRGAVSELAQGRRRVLFAARGSSDNAAVYGRYLLETRAGVLGSLLSPSVATHYRSRLDLSDTLVVCVSQSGATSEILGLYGRALSLNGQYAEAEHAFKLASEKLPTDPAILPQLASVAQRLGHLDDARQALEKYAALVDDDRDQAAHALQIAELSLQLNDPASAATWYEKSAALGEPDANLLARLADAQLKAGRIDAARQTLARAVVKDAKNPSVRAVALRIQHVAEPVPEKVESQHQ